MKAYFYCRVAHDDSFSLERQAEELRRYTKQAGYTIVGAAAEHGSGMTLDRPARQEVFILNCTRSDINFCNYIPQTIITEHIFKSIVSRIAYFFCLRSICLINRYFIIGSISDMEVPEMPDPALSVQDMKDYGYAWAGVLPAGREAAEKALEKSCEVYCLYSDNTEGLCVDAKEIADHAAKGGMLGVSKESWMAALEKENYLKAAEMAMEDDYGMIDGIINNGPKENKTAEVKAPETGEKSSIMDRLKSAKADKQKECCAPQKHKGELDL